MDDARLEIEHRPFVVWRRVVNTVYRKPLDALDDLGDQLSFYGRALAWTPRTVRRSPVRTG